jgi:hypothetical protein
MCEQPRLYKSTELQEEEQRTVYEQLTYSSGNV